MSRGHIRKRGKTWAVVVDLGRDATTGRRVRKWHSGHRTRADAQRALTEILGRLDQGTYVAPARVSLAEFIEHHWLPAIRDTIRESTWVSYAANLRTHVIPRLGTVQLQKLTPPQLNGLYAELRADGSRRDGEKGALSQRTVRLIHTILRKALKDAMRWGLTVRNVADAADPPKNGSSREMKTWTAPDLKRFLDAAAGDRLYPAFQLAAATGMRKGEVLGVPWADVDLDAGRLAVRQTLITVGNRPVVSKPKTERSRRSIKLDARTVAVLKRWHARQAAERLALGADWRETGFVFTAQDGNYVHPDRFDNAFKSAMRRAGVPVIRLHDLRHTWATLALQAGVHPKVVSEVLGHAHISITLQVYSHALPALMDEATSKVADLVHGQDG